MAKSTITEKPLAHIEHVIVLMFENRSFDNVLGNLYPSGPNFNGIPLDFGCPFTDDNGHTVLIKPWTLNDVKARIMPAPDPNEEYEDMKEQIAGGTMKGFANNYAKALKAVNVPATIDNVRQIMQYFRRPTPANPGNMPISNMLAKQYAVSDAYFGSGPVQTWPNRIFAHCGTPGSYYDQRNRVYKSYVNNTEYPDHDIMYGNVNYKCVFEQIDQVYKNDVNKPWKVYYDGTLPISSIIKYVNDRFYRFENGGNVCDFDAGNSGYSDFFSDLAGGQLPRYSFIEPRYQTHSTDGDVPPNSNHPGSVYVTGNNGKGPFINVLHGELLLQRIYNALLAYPETFKKTLLMITYDEHGGVFDHVTPPPAISPFTQTMANFNYNMYGPRVPAIFINPYITPQTVLRPPRGKYFDHTSIIATLRDQLGLRGYLTPRDQYAPTFTGLINPNLKKLNWGPKSMPDINTLLPKEPYPQDYVRPKKLPKEKSGDIKYAIYNTAFLNKKTRIDKKKKK